MSVARVRGRPKGPPFGVRCMLVYFEIGRFTGQVLQWVPSDSSWFSLNTRQKGGALRHPRRLGVGDVVSLKTANLRKGHDSNEPYSNPEMGKSSFENSPKSQVVSLLCRLMLTPYESTPVY